MKKITLDPGDMAPISVARTTWVVEKIPTYMRGRPVKETVSLQVGNLRFEMDSEEAKDIANQMLKAAEGK